MTQTIKSVLVIGLGLFALWAMWTEGAFHPRVPGGQFDTRGLRR